MSTSRTTRRSRRNRGGDRIPLIKDMILFGLGAGLIAWQGFFVPAKDFNWIPMVFGGVLANVPGAVQLWSLRPGTSPIGSSPLPPEVAPSSPLPPSSPSA